MLSPAGVHSKPDDFDLDRELEAFPAERRLPKIAYKMTPIVWYFKISAFSMMRFCGSYLARKMINKFVQKRLRADRIGEQEIEDYKMYLHQTLLMDGSSEYLLYVCFDSLMFARHPLELEDRLGNADLPIPISFFYGAEDWIKRSGGDNVVAKNRFSGTLSHVHIIENSDHHMYWDNPDEFA
jgi:pimeloyl-ACP methyl ester carboxylesterase